MTSSRWCYNSGLVLFFACFLRNRVEERTLRLAFVVAVVVVVVVVCELLNQSSVLRSAEELLRAVDGVPGNGLR